MLFAPALPVRRLLAALAAALALLAALASSLPAGLAPKGSDARYCPHGAVRQDVAAAASKIKAAAFTSDRRDAFQSYLSSSTLPFDADGVGLLWLMFSAPSLRPRAISVSALPDHS